MLSLFIVHIAYDSSHGAMNKTLLKFKPFFLVMFLDLSLQLKKTEFGLL